MKIQGFQKLTLLDFPGKTACTIFTGGCNFRCPFCHNALLVIDIDKNEDYNEEEIFDTLNKRKGILDGVAITGGEPLIHKDIDKFIRKVRELGYAVKLDTNGSFPDYLKMLIDEKLIDYVAMDIKNCKEKYGETIGIPNYDTSNIEKSINILINSGLDFEFRTTICKEFHTTKDVEKISQWIKGCKKYFLQNFKDSGELIEDGLHPVEPETLKQMREIALKNLPHTEIRGIDL